MRHIVCALTGMAFLVAGTGLARAAKADRLEVRGDRLDRLAAPAAVAPGRTAAASAEPRPSVERDRKGNVTITFAPAMLTSPHVIKIQPRRAPPE